MRQLLENLPALQQTIVYHIATPMYINGWFYWKRFCDRSGHVKRLHWKYVVMKLLWILLSHIILHWNGNISLMIKFILESFWRVCIILCIIQHLYRYLTLQSWKECCSAPILCSLNQSILRMDVFHKSLDWYPLQCMHNWWSGGTVAARPYCRHL